MFSPITFHHYLVLSAILFTLGLLGLTLRRNLLIVFMCIEVLLNSVNLVFIAIARMTGSVEAHVIVFFVMAVAAAEAAVGLAIVTSMFRNRQTIKTDDWGMLNG